jgi:hypothetical protein
MKQQPWKCYGYAVEMLWMNSSHGNAMDRRLCTIGVQGRSMKGFIGNWVATLLFVF